mmetsp:Transcript_981/g.2336  ORF Transcript_981/g.2336 Transcript_981/m.2336 type:complete len:310 (-) Transcript_981:866-1795(-)
MFKRLCVYQCYFNLPWFFKSTRVGGGEQARELHGGIRVLTSLANIFRDIMHALMLDNISALLLEVTIARAPLAVIPNVLGSLAKSHRDFVRLAIRSEKNFRRRGRGRVAVELLLLLALPKGTDKTFVRVRIVRLAFIEYLQKSKHVCSCASEVTFHIFVKDSSDWHAVVLLQVNTNSGASTCFELVLRLLLPNIIHILDTADLVRCEPGALTNKFLALKRTSVSTSMTVTLGEKGIKGGSNNVDVTITEFPDWVSVVEAMVRLHNGSLRVLRIECLTLKSLAFNVTISVDRSSIDPGTCTNNTADPSVA